MAACTEVSQAQGSKQRILITHCVGMDDHGWQDITDDAGNVTARRRTLRFHTTAGSYEIVVSQDESVL